MLKEHSTLCWRAFLLLLDAPLFLSFAGPPDGTPPDAPPPDVIVVLDGRADTYKELARFPAPQTCSTVLARLSEEHGRGCLFYGNRPYTASVPEQLHDGVYRFRSFAATAAAGTTLGGGVSKTPHHDGKTPPGTPGPLAGIPGRSGSSVDMLASFWRALEPWFGGCGKDQHRDGWADEHAALLENHPHKE